MNKILSIVTLFVLMVPVIWGQDSVIDIDGNVYETVQIGEQLWMKENLKVTHYRNGDEIPTGYSDAVWENLTTGAYAVYDNNESNADIYGYLYNWYGVDDDRGICPVNWHVPTDGEYTALSDYLGGESAAGGKLKECTEGSCPESEYWYSPNTEATNESGFTGLPGGAHYYYSNSRHIGYNGSFWSSSEYGSNDAWHRGLESNDSTIYRRDYGKDSGFSVRCVKDETETNLIPYSTGWNLVGLPLEVEYPSYAAVFPNAIPGTLFLFDGTYSQTQELINGIGYWLRFDEPDTVSITGTTIQELSINLMMDWNLISAISDVVDISHITDSENIIIPGTFYGFEDNYTQVSQLEPGKGYWVRANSSGSITLIDN